MFMWMNKSAVSAEIELPCNVGAKHQNPTRYGVLPNVSEVNEVRVCSHTSCSSVTFATTPST